MSGTPASFAVLGTQAGERDRRAGGLRSLPVLEALSRPVALARHRTLEVDPALAGLLPEGGLRRGSVVALSSTEGSGITSLALALTAAASRAGAWVTVVGLPELGLVSAAELGVALDRLVLVPAAGEQWTAVVAALLDGVDILILGAPRRTRSADARRLQARAKERGAVLVVVPTPGAASPGEAGWWPGVADVQLVVTAARWKGLGDGFGHLRARAVEVAAGGRRAAARPRRTWLWLPGPDGRLAPVGPAPALEGAGIALAGSDVAEGAGGGYEG